MRVDQENTSRLIGDGSGLRPMRWNKRNYTEGKKNSGMIWLDLYQMIGIKDKT
jgi:hypothetical protein